MNVKIALLEPLLGTVPKNPETYKEWIESKKPENQTEEEWRTVEQIEQSGWNGFHQDENGLFIYDYMVKGFLKNAGNILKEEIGIKNLRSKLNEYMFVFPRRIRFSPNRMVSDDVLERPVRAMTMQGPRVTIKRSDVINPPAKIEVEIRLLRHKEINEEVISELLKYGELQGLGEWRNGSYGRFSFEICDSPMAKVE